MINRLKQPYVPGFLTVPGWDKYPWLFAAFSTRQGGASIAYGDAEQNLGWTLDEEEQNTASNRNRFVRAVAGNAEMELVTARQFHSGVIKTVQKDHSPLATANGRAVLEADALITDLPGKLLGIQTADCVPVLVVDMQKKVVAAFHAGWRGTLARIVERSVALMHHQYGSDHADLIAAIGPAIGPCCFTVGDEVRAEFEAHFAYAPSLFTGPPIHLDLFEANRQQLLAAGVPSERIWVAGECSACTGLSDGRRKYFSHRAEHGFTGRMLSVVGVSDL